MIFSKFRKINWMLGGHYNFIDVSVPVRSNGKKEERDGKYSLVVWEEGNKSEFQRSMHISKTCIYLSPITPPQLVLMETSF